MGKNEIHNLIIGHSSASTTAAAQNFHTYSISNAEFDGMVQICNFYCANIKLKKKTELPGKTS